MKIPNRFEKLKSRHGKFIEAVEALGKAVRAEGPTEEKTALLIQLAAAAAVKSEGSVHSHTRRALAAGATPEEITHAVILLTSIIGFPAVAAALSWVDDILDDIS
ncbi:MAG: carboxymuconolactone decarboxylase family protein [Nitrospirae bacterium YQR-1]